MAPATKSLTAEQQLALDHFTNLTEIMAKRQQQVEELGKLRRDAAAVCRSQDLPGGPLPVADMAKAAGIGQQAVYKLLAPTD